MLVEVGAFTVLNHAKVLVIQFALLEVIDCVSLRFILVFQRLLVFIEQPFKNGRIVLGERLNLVKCVSHVLITHFLSNLLLLNEVYDRLEL